MMPDGATVRDALAACVGARFADTVAERASLRDRVAAAAADDDDNDGADERDTSLAGAAIVARRGWPAEDNSLEWRHTFSYSSTRETTSIQERHIAYVGLPKRLAPNGPSSTTLLHWMWPPCSSYSRRMHCYSMFTTSKGFFWNDPSGIDRLLLLRSRKDLAGARSTRRTHTGLVVLAHLRVDNGCSTSNGIWSLLAL